MQRPILEILSRKAVHISCEVFPPKEFAQIDDVKAVVGRLAALRPAYVSVTYGAAGKTPQFTREVAQAVLQTGTTALSHLTCINNTRSTVLSVLDDLAAAGIVNVLALRGDIPPGDPFPGPDHFTHADELIAAVKRRGGFCVGAACYPEGHPESPGKDADLDHLRRKADAGADFLTTQMFFDNNILYNFLYRALQKGITVPVCAGIMPVVRAKQIKRIAALSGASMPPRFAAIVDRFGDDPRCMRQAGVAYATEQIIDLIANGVNHIHLYTMNDPGVAGAIFDNLGCIVADGNDGEA